MIELSDFAEKVKYYYELHMWTLSRVDKALELGKITQVEYDMIIGKTGE